MNRKQCKIYQKKCEIFNITVQFTKKICKPYRKKTVKFKENRVQNINQRTEVL